MWGVGSSVGPHVIAYAVSGGSWRSGYLFGAFLVFFLAGFFGISMPRWKRTVTPGENAAGKTLFFMQALRVPGVLVAMTTFFCYSALEQGTALWAASYLAMSRGLDLAAAAQGAGMFYIGIAVGRALSGFISYKLNDDRMVLLGQSAVLAGVCLLLLGDVIPATVVLLLIGLGCAPMNPSLLHSIPGHFGRSQAQAIMAALLTVSHAGSLVMTPVFGWIAQFTGVGIYPWFLLCILSAMFSSHRFLYRYKASISKSSE